MPLDQVVDVAFTRPVVIFPRGVLVVAPGGQQVGADLHENRIAHSPGCPPTSQITISRTTSPTLIGHGSAPSVASNSPYRQPSPISSSGPSLMLVRRALRVLGRGAAHGCA